MFLIAFVTLVVSIIGLYAQVLSLQTAKINAAQSALTQTLITWHGAAVSYVHENLGTVFTLIPPPTLPDACQITVPGDSPYGMPFCLGAVALALTGDLPPGYATTPYTFLSAVFQSGGAIYVVTFVPPPNATNATSDLFLPADNTVSKGQTQGTEIGYSINDVMRQFANITTNYLAYGAVTQSTTPNGVLTLMGASNGAVGAGAGLTFPIPPLTPSLPHTAWMPFDAVALISTAN